MKTGFEDLVYSVTMRCYCKCGVAICINSDLTGAFDIAASFWGKHNGKQHGETTPSKCRLARIKLQKEEGRT